MTKLLTFEHNKDDSSVEIHLNREGLDRLIQALTFFKKNKQDHVVLLTEEWGDKNGLTSEKQGKNNELFNKIKLFMWS